MGGTKKHKDVGSRSVPLLSSPPFLSLPHLSMTLVQAKWQGQMTERVNSRSQTLTSFPQTSAYSISKLNGRDKRRKISVRKSHFRPLVPLRLIPAKRQGQVTEGMDERTSSTRVIMAEI